MLSFWKRVFALPRVDRPDRAGAAAKLVDLFEMRFEGELYETPAPRAPLSEAKPADKSAFDLAARPASAK